MGDLASIVKAYDIRGVVPDCLDEGVAEAAREPGATIIHNLITPRTNAVSGGEHSRHFYFRSGEPQAIFE